jgi:hypothetical protein
MHRVFSFGVVALLAIPACLSSKPSSPDIAPSESGSPSDPVFEGDGGDSGPDADASREDVGPTPAVAIQLKGSVLGERGGAPGASLPVVVQDAAGHRFDAQTDAEGRFVVDGVVAPYDLRVTTSLVGIPWDFAYFGATRQAPVVRYVDEAPQLRKGAFTVAVPKEACIRGCEVEVRAGSRSKGLYGHASENLSGAAYIVKVDYEIDNGVANEAALPVFVLIRNGGGEYQFGKGVVAVSEGAVPAADLRYEAVKAHATAINYKLALPIGTYSSVGIDVGEQAFTLGAMGSGESKWNVPQVPGATLWVAATSVDNADGQSQRTSFFAQSEIPITTESLNVAPTIGLDLVTPAHGGTIRAADGTLVFSPDVPKSARAILLSAADATRRVALHVSPDADVHLDRLSALLGAFAPGDYTVAAKADSTAPTVNHYLGEARDTKPVVSREYVTRGIKLAP